MPERVANAEVGKDLLIAAHITRHRTSWKIRYWRIDVTGFGETSSRPNVFAAARSVRELIDSQQEPDIRRVRPVIVSKMRIFFTY